MDQVGQHVEGYPRANGEGRLPDELLHMRANGSGPSSTRSLLSATSSSTPVLVPVTKARAVWPSGQVATAASYPCRLAAVDVRPTEATGGSVYTPRGMAR